MSTNNNNDVPVFLSAQTSQVGGSKQTGISLATTLNSVFQPTQQQPPPPTEAQIMLRDLWQKQMQDIKNQNQNSFKVQELPLARIKKIMKMEEEVVMISAEAPMLFAKAAQLFINELTLRSWIHTEENKRRTLQRQDIATAISKFDQFDFLIDIVPRDEVNPHQQANKNNRDGQLQYFYQVPTPQRVSTSTTTNSSGGGNKVIQIPQNAVVLTPQSATTTSSSGNQQVQTVQVVQPDKQPQAISIDQLQQFISSRGISTNEISQIQITPDGQLQIVKNQQQQNSAAGRNNMQFDLN